jgi:uroporphyrinogen-III synthase
LDRSAEVFRARRLVSPAVIVVGDVARLAGPLSWFGGARPLLGRTVVTTRPAAQNGHLRALLEARGAEVVSAPSIRIEPLGRNERKSVRNALSNREAGRFDWIVFLSANGARYFVSLYGKNRARPRARCLAVGPHTAEALREMGWRPDRVARAFNARGAAAALGVVKKRNILVARVEDGPGEFIRRLESRGAIVTELPVYRTRSLAISSAVRRRVLREGDAITFTSASTVRGFMASTTRAERERFFRRAVIVSIGRQTSRELRRYRPGKVITARPSTSAGLVESLVEYFGALGRRK